VVSVQNANTEFNRLFNYNNDLVLSNTQIQNQTGLNATSWNNQMLMWSDYRFYDPSIKGEPRWTAYAVIALAKQYRNENNLILKQQYEILSKKGAEFLLWLQDICDLDGGIPFRLIDTTSGGIYETGIAGVAFVECYRSFGDSKYKAAAIKTADWHLSHPGYPYIAPFGFKYYSNVNHLARSLRNLAEVYSITGKQVYLDAAFEIAEEIVAWQDYKHDNCPWGNQIPDGSWYWWDYGPTEPLPNGCIPNPEPGAFSPQRRTSYHNATLLGLAKLLEVTSQHILPGTTTVRNDQSFIQFREDMIRCIKKAINYIIANQETLSTSGGRVYGMIKEFKNHLDFGNYPNAATSNYVHCPLTLYPVITAYKALLQVNALEPSEITNLNLLINSISTAMYGINPTGWSSSEEYTEGFLPCWAYYSDFRQNFSPNDSVLKLLNANFEEKDIVWELWSWDENGVDISSNASYTGNKSIYILDTSSASKWAGLLVSAKPNTTYQLNARNYLLNGLQSLYMKYYDSSFSNISYDYVTNTDYYYWKEVSLTRQTPPNTSYIEIWLYSPTTQTSNGYWDAISLHEIAPKVTTKDKILAYTSNINIFPNPAHQFINVKITGGNDGDAVYITNSVGIPMKTLHLRNVSNTEYIEKIDVTNWDNGNYYITLYNNFEYKRFPFTVTK
jgi:hypothetical protein